MRRLQRIFPEERPKEACIQLQVFTQLHGGQGQAEPVPLLPFEEVLQGWDEEGCRSEREGQDQQENAQPGGHHDWPQWTLSEDFAER